MKKITIIALILLPFLAVLFEHEIITPVFLLVWILLVIPACIMYLIDWFRSSEDANISTIIGKNLLRIPIAIFGTILLLFGLAIIFWVLYNIFFERQVEYTGPSTILGGFGVGPSLTLFGFYLIRLSLKKTVVRKK